jgi:mRNA interferase MazF
VRRGELYKVQRPKGDKRTSRVFVIVSRRALVESRFSTVVCAPVYTRRHGLSTEVDVGPDEGLKHDSSILCDALMSIPKGALSDFVGTLGPEKLDELDRALRVALALE